MLEPTKPKVLKRVQQLAGKLRSYLLAFSPTATNVLQKFDLLTQIERLDRANLP